MAWSAPMTAVASSVFTAAQFNTFIRDNLNETAPAKATVSSSHFAATGENEIAERLCDENTDLGVATTTLTSYGDPESGSPGPTVAVDTGRMAWVVVQGQVSNSGTGSARMAYEVSVDTSIAAADNRGIGISGSAGVTLTASAAILHVSATALNPGLNVFTAKYRVSSGTGTFQSRHIAVFPL